MMMSKCGVWLINLPEVEGSPEIFILAQIGYLLSSKVNENMSP
jgi:hypothetical protein